MSAPVVDVTTLTLKCGSHGQPRNLEQAEVCVMEGVYLADALARGVPVKEIIRDWTDRPECACPVITRFLQCWNDSITDDDERTRLLRPLLLLPIGTRSTPSVAVRRMWLAVDWDLRSGLPTLLRLSDPSSALAGALETLPEICSPASMAPATALLLEAAAGARTRLRDADPRFAVSAVYAVSAVDAVDAVSAKAAWSAILDAARAGGYAAARRVAEELLGKPLRSNHAEAIAAVQASTQDLVRRMCALKADSA